VTDPTTPILAGRWDGAYSYGNLAVSGGYAYLANFDSGLWILGLSDPADPNPLSYLGTPGGACDVAVAGGWAYVADDEWGLLVVDVSDPLEPEVVGFLDTPGYARDVEVLGTTAYVMDHQGNLFLVDVRHPHRPEEVAHWDSPGRGRDLAIDGGYVYLAVGSWGLRIFPARSTFGDVGNDYWAFEHVEACVGSGIVDGYPDGLYHSELPVTRDQMAVYVSRALAGGDASVPEAGPDPTFSDVPEDHWAYGYVEYAAQEQVVRGFSDGLYRPGLELDRGQMAVYIARSLAGSDDAVPNPTGPQSFEDVPDTFWSCRHVEYCVSQGVVAGYGDGLYHPELTVTRDQMAVYVSRAFGLL
jgi:hypothetical protein